MEFTEKALVLKVGQFRENDLWVRLLTSSRGMLTAFAFGGSRSRRRFLGCLDALNLVLFRIGSSKRGAYLTLEEGTLLQGFPGLRGDARRLGVVANCLRFLEAMEIGPQGGRAAFDLLLDGLQVLEKTGEPPEIFPLLFRAKAAFEQGFAPDLTVCHGCGRPAGGLDTAFFLVEKGRLSCSDCRPAAGLALPACPGAVQTLVRLGQSRPADWLRLELTGLVRRQCYEIIERFVAFHLGLSWEGGRFRKV